MWKTLKRLAIFFVVTMILAAAGPFLRRHHAPRHVERTLRAAGVDAAWAGAVAGGLSQGIAWSERGVARACRMRVLLSKVPVSELQAMTAACDAPVMVGEAEGFFRDLGR